MRTCDHCGNSYHHTFEVLRDGSSYIFDSFECAIQVLAPTCAHCQCRVIGHGVEADRVVYCCAHCARQAGTDELRDSV
jgi:hypothetical protein